MSFSWLSLTKKNKCVLVLKNLFNFKTRKANKKLESI